jgi:hypothetical protein
MVLMRPLIRDAPMHDPEMKTGPREAGLLRLRSVKLNSDFINGDDGARDDDASGGVRDGGASDGARDGGASDGANDGGASDDDASVRVRDDANGLQWSGPAWRPAARQPRHPD